ncbi:hypothetical protein MY4824_008484 [Beauveria thailandica]
MVTSDSCAEFTFAFAFYAKALSASVRLTGNLGGLIHDSADAVASRRRDGSLTNAMHDKSRPSHA